MLPLNNLHAFTTQLESSFKRYKRWADKNHLSCFRFYDCQVPGFAFLAHLYENHFVFWYLDNNQDELPQKLVQAVSETCKTDPSKVVFKRQSGQKNSPYEHGQGKKQFIVAREGGLQFKLNLSDYLETGLFLDHRWTRSYVRELSAGLRVLNLFAYTGSFSLYAACGGAFETVSVDLNHNYLDWAKDNFVLNGLDSSQHRFLQEDCLEFLSVETQRYDLIVLDPPTFSNSNKMKRTFNVQRDHIWLIQRCLKLLNPGGLLFFSNNYRQFKLDHRALEGVIIQDISTLTVPKDFHKMIHKTYLISKTEQPCLRFLDREAL